MTGCLSIGTKTETQIVYASIGAHDETLDSSPRIATNKPIPVTVVDKAAELDLGGWYAVPERDLKALVDEIKRLKGPASE